MKPDRVLYVVIAAVALVWTQWLVFEMVQSGVSASGAWEAMTANATAQFMSVDLIGVFLAAMTFMIVEGRRLRVTLWWIYPLIGLTIAISVAFPLFLLARTTSQDS
jgi:hypothetical protein